MEMAPSPEGTEGLWGAQRVPEGDFFAAANEFCYEGTEFDLTGSVAAGPFGCPERYLGPDDLGGDAGDPSVRLNGAWERPISMFYTGYAVIKYNYMIRDIRQRADYWKTRAEKPVGQAQLADPARSAPARAAAVYGIP